MKNKTKNIKKKENLRNQMDEIRSCSIQRIMLSVERKKIMTIYLYLCIELHDPFESRGGKTYCLLYGNTATDTKKSQKFQVIIAYGFSQFTKQNINLLYVFDVIRYSV